VSFPRPAPTVSQAEPVGVRNRRLGPEGKLHSVSFYIEWRNRMPMNDAQLGFVIRRIVTEKYFAEAMAKDPKAALASMGYSMTPEEEARVRLHTEEIEALALPPRWGPKIISGVLSATANIATT